MPTISPSSRSSRTLSPRACDGEPVVEAHPVRDDEHRELARAAERVVDVGRGRQRGERAVAARRRARAHRRGSGSRGRLGALLVEPGRPPRAARRSRPSRGSGCREKQCSWSRARSQATNGAYPRSQTPSRRTAASGSAQRGRAPASGRSAPRLAHAGLEAARAAPEPAGSQKPRAQLPLRLGLRAARRAGLEVRGELRRRPRRSARRPRSR